MATATAAKTDQPGQVDLSALKAKQHGAWSSGDYAIVGTTLQIVGEELCEAMDLRAGQKVLDVAAGNGNATLAAARRWCDVVSTDYVPSLLERGRARAAAEGLSVQFEEADAEALTYSDAAFDAVVSTFGVMFTPDQDKAASELLRVCKSGGKIGLANWTPDGFIGQLFKAEKRNFAFRYRSPMHFLDVFRTYYGPTLKAFAALDETNQLRLADDILKLIASMNRAEDGTMVLPSEYLEIVIVKR
jgi:ubiquinone/menaquinone biosynthesis C-methylase UbiE